MEGSIIKKKEHYAKLARQHIARTSNTAREMWKLSERAAPIVKVRQTDVRVLYAREILTRFLVVAKLLKGLVARDGIEPPTPAFSGPLTDSLKWF
jgi:hypothetical protein